VEAAVEEPVVPVEAVRAGRDPGEWHRVEGVLSGVAQAVGAPSGAAPAAVCHGLAVRVEGKAQRAVRAKADQREKATRVGGSARALAGRARIRIWLAKAPEARAIRRVGTRVWEVGRYIEEETDPTQRVVNPRVGGRLIPRIGRWRRRQRVARTSAMPVGKT
jgi:hypothetical protein